MNTLWTKIGLLALGVVLLTPMTLLTASVVVAEGQVRESSLRAREQAPPASGEYAQSFAMTIFEQDRTIRLWLVDLDSEPYFRQTVESGGSTVSDQIYRFDERTLYTTDATAAGAAWSSITPVEPQDLALTNLITGPAAWAAEFGPGEEEIPIGAGTTVRVIIESVDEAIEPTVFEVPPGVTVTPLEPEESQR